MGPAVHGSAVHYITESVLLRLPGMPVDCSEIGQAVPSCFPMHSCCDWLINICRRKKKLKACTVWLGCPAKCEGNYPRHSIKSQKYNLYLGFYKNNSSFS